MPKTGRRVARHATIPRTSGTGWGAASPIVDGLCEQYTRLFEPCTDARVQLDDGSPASTRSPGLACSTGRRRDRCSRPARSRPAPSSMDAPPDRDPRACASRAPRERDVNVADARGACGSRVRSSMIRGSPPWCSITSRNFSSAAPERERLAHARSRGASQRRRRRAGASAPPARRTAPPGPTVPARAACRCTPRSRARCPPRGRAARPWRSARPLSSCPLPRRSRPSPRPAARASASVFMNAPRPTFTSSTSPSMPSAIFLLMIDEAMSGMLSTVPVTSRSAYSFLSAGAMSASARSSAQPIALAAHARNASAIQVRRGTRGWPPACRACRRCGRGRGRNIFGTTTPHAATSGATTMRGLVADAARGVLVDLEPGMSRQIQHARPEAPSPRSTRPSPRAVMPRRSIAISSAEV